MTPRETCCCCDAPPQTGLAPWHLVCPTCGYERAHLEPAINVGSAHDELDEAQRDTGLRALRDQNFRQLLDRLVPQLPGKRLLDVGAAHGWFVQRAAERGLQAEGIEPDEAVCAQAQRNGAPLRPGFFPQALREGERFDAIAFNDVFEHIPDAAGILRACHERLEQGGLLVVNLPSSRGVFYRTSKLLQRLGLPGSFERMWQKGLPSPHVHYFDAANLSRLGARHGFEAIDTFHLPSVRVRGLYSRIASVRSGRWKAPIVWLGVVLAYPLLAVLPADIDVVVFRRVAAPRSGG
ncbi:class I SAM-dependent methyltransferase [Ramlibacter albus]|uniref:Class I SAM-dependent methyltransferase n=1 Tax=Ramlibacter albus TaxID=2079448 RepID=A0A923S533_9BURK|nr:class I SAM-dependent methyltransferase [Ramlibacter albus]MBC5764752.1 class I SAM-dependent methyltransferase [Ramlibacter albus]